MTLYIVVMAVTVSFADLVGLRVLDAYATWNTGRPFNAALVCSFADNPAAGRQIMPMTTGMTQIEPGHSGEMVSSPQRGPLRIERIVVGEPSKAGWTIDELRWGDAELFDGVLPMPLDHGVGQLLFSGSIVQVGQQVRMKVTNHAPGEPANERVLVRLDGVVYRFAGAGVERIETDSPSPAPTWKDLEGVVHEVTFAPDPDLTRLIEIRPRLLEIRFDSTWTTLGVPVDVPLTVAALWAVDERTGECVLRAGECEQGFPSIDTNAFIPVEAVQ